MDEHALVQLANEVLSKLPGSPRVEHWTEITSEIFVKMYEGLFAEALPDVVRNPKCKEDEVHNIQSVIDTLSLDILNTSLSHLSGESIVEGNKEALKSLLEVFQWLFEYILDKIGSDTSLDGLELYESKLADLTDPDVVTSEVIDSILERELGKDYSSLRQGSTSRYDKKSSGQLSKYGGNSTEELIALGQTNSVSFSKNGSLEKTTDLIALGNSRQDAKSPNKNMPASKLAATSKMKPSRTSLSSTSSDVLPVKLKTASRSPRLARTVGLGQGAYAREYSDILEGDLSSIRMADSLAEKGVSSSAYREGPLVGRSPGPVGQINRSEGSGYLSTGPISDSSNQGLGKETTAELIKESEMLEKRLGLRTSLTEPAWTHSSMPPYKTTSLEPNLAGVDPYSKPGISTTEVSRTNFSHTATGLPQEGRNTGVEYRDTFASSIPRGHQYHGSTHHLYQHYPAGGGLGQGVGLGDRVVEPYRQPFASVHSLGAEPRYEADPASEARAFEDVATSPSKPEIKTSSTQVTPGRFLETVIADSPSSEELFREVPANYSQSDMNDRSKKPVKSKLHSYHNLSYLVQDTKRMSEKALAESPLKETEVKDSLAKQSDSAVTVDSSDDELTRRLRETLQKVHSEESVSDRSRTSLVERSLSQSNAKRQENVRPKQSSAHVPPKRKISEEKRPLPRKVSFANGSNRRARSANTDSTPSASGSGSSRSLRQSRSSRSSVTSAPQTKTAVQKSALRSPNSKYGLGKNVANRRAERLAQTAEEYFEKYYGGSPPKGPSSSLSMDDSLLYDRSANDTRSDKDLVVDYRGNIEAEIEEYKNKLKKRAKQVHFDDIIDDSAPGHMATIRHKLHKEEQKAKFRQEFLKDLYDQELVEFEERVNAHMEQISANTKLTDKEFKKNALKSPKLRLKSSPPKTSVLLPKTKAKNWSSPFNKRKRYSPLVRKSRPRTLACDNEILPFLLNEFPFLHVSPETLHSMWRKSARQIGMLSKSDQYAKAKKKRAEQEIEQAEQKQKLLTDIAKRETDHIARMRELETRKKQQYAVKSTMRDKRLQHARIRKYYDDYHIRMRSKMLKKRNREEMVFKKLFEEAMCVQRDRIRDLRSYARDQRKSRAKTQRDQLESIENFYRDRIAMLAEALKQEKEERLVKARAQKQVLNTLSREYRKKTEQEIEVIQDQIFRDEDEEYFRQIDADRLRQDLNLARYKARV